MYPQLDEHDPAFIAVERDERGHENCRVFRRGKDTALWSCHFPPHVNSKQGLVVEDFQDCEFKSRLWREVECRDTDGSGPCVVDNAVDAAAAMHGLVQGWAKCCITVDPDSGCVSFAQDDCCIICNVSRQPFFQFVKISGLPPSFIDLEQAQFLINPINHFQKGRVYVWAPPPGSGGTRLVFGLSRSTSFWDDEYGDLGDPAVFVAHTQVQEHDPAFQAVERRHEECVHRKFLHCCFVSYQQFLHVWVFPRRFEHPPSRPRKADACRV
jgi:hypothetical protein